MLRDFGSFISALWSEWKVLLTGGSIFALSALWNLFGGQPLPQSVNWLILGLTLMLAAFFAWRRQWIDAGRNIVTLRPAELAALVRNRTTVQADTFAKPYIGKRIIVTGAINEVSRGGPLAFVSLKISDDVRVEINLPFWKLRPFVPLPTGTIVTVAGRIRTIDYFGIKLANCDVVPTPPEGGA